MANARGATLDALAPLETDKVCHDYLAGAPLLPTRTTMTLHLYVSGHKEPGYHNKFGTLIKIRADGSAR